MFPYSKYSVGFCCQVQLVAVNAGTCLGLQNVTISSVRLCVHFMDFVIIIDCCAFGRLLIGSILSLIDSL